eukprot:7360896-Prymnesium_polylepis.1
MATRTPSVGEVVTVKTGEGPYSDRSGTVTEVLDGGVLLLAFADGERTRLPVASVVAQAPGKRD